MSYLQIFISIVDRGRHGFPLAPAVGRTLVLTPDDELKLAKLLDEKAMCERAADKNIRDKVFFELALERRRKSGKGAFGYTPSKSTTSRYVAKLSHKRSRPQYKTERRLYAESDIRNFVTETAILEAIYNLGDIKAHNFCNTDVTTAVLSSEGAEFQAVYVGTETEKKLRKLKRAVTRATPTKAQFLRIRMNVTTTATGQMVVLVLSKRGCCKQGIEEPIKIILPGLNNTGDPVTPAYLYLVPEKYTERAFMTLVMKDHILPTICAQRDRALQAQRDAADIGQSKEVEIAENTMPDECHDEELDQDESDDESDDEAEEEDFEIQASDNVSPSQYFTRRNRRKRMMDFTAENLGVEKEIEETANIRLDRLVWSFDGDIPQIQAVLEEEMAAYTEKHRIELFKFAAACSGKQQPNDVMKGFLVLKRLLRSLKFKYSELQEVEIPSYMPNLKLFLQKNSTFDSKERQLVESFFEKLPQVLRVSMSPKIIADGYRGLIPFDKEYLLSQCTYWDKFSEETQQHILKSIPKLAKQAERFQLTENMLDIAEIPASPQPPDPEGFMDSQTKRKREVHKKPRVPFEELPLWRQRATWLNQEWVRLRSRKEATLKRKEAARKLEVAEAKKADAEKKELLKEVKPWLQNLLKEVAKLDGARVKAEKEAKKEEARKAAPKQAISKAMKTLLHQYCTNCSKQFKTGARGWQGCAYCDYKWWCATCHKPDLVKNHETLCKKMK